MHFDGAVVVAVRSTATACPVHLIVILPSHAG